MGIPDPFPRRVTCKAADSPRDRRCVLLCARYSGQGVLIQKGGGGLSHSWCVCCFFCVRGGGAWPPHRKMDMDSSVWTPLLLPRSVRCLAAGETPRSGLALCLVGDMT